MNLEKNQSYFFNEDCLVGMKDIPDHSIDLVIADPPYGVTRLAYDTPICMEAFFKEVWRVCKPNAAVLVFGVEPFSSKTRMFASDPLMTTLNSPLDYIV